MYIPLIPQRRETSSSIWGPPGGNRKNLNAQHPSRAWQPATGMVTSPMGEMEQNTVNEITQHTTHRQPSSIALARHLDTLDTATDLPPPVNMESRPTPSACISEKAVGSDDALSITQLLRSLDISSTPSGQQYDSSLDSSILTASSSSSSPVQSIPTPPDASPLHLLNTSLPPTEFGAELDGNLVGTPVKGRPRRNYGLSVPAPIHDFYRHIESPIQSSVAAPLEHSYGLLRSGLHQPAQVPDRASYQNFQTYQTVRPQFSYDISSHSSVYDNHPSHPLVATNNASSAADVISPFDPSPPRSNSVFYDHRLQHCNQPANESPTDSWKSITLNQKDEQPVNFLHLLSPSSSPQYSVFVHRIITHSDQQASIFLQQKLKASGDHPQERMKIVDAICSSGFEMMCNRFGNWAVQRCLDSNLTREEKHKLVNCMRGRVVELATNCYGTHCLQKLLDCEEEIRLAIVSELLVGDPCATLLNKHASHVWSKIMELPWSPPSPPIFDYINEALAGKWLYLACHETGSLVVQHAFENLDPQSKEGIVRELLCSKAGFREVVKNQWGSFCVSHLLELGSPEHKRSVLELLLADLHEYATHEHGIKSVLKAVKDSPIEFKSVFVETLCSPPDGGRRAMVVDIALSSIGSQLLNNLLPNLSKEQRSKLYDSMRPFIVTLRGSKTGSKAIWLLDTQRSHALDKLMSRLRQ